MISFTYGLCYKQVYLSLPSCSIIFESLDSGSNKFSLKIVWKQTGIVVNEETRKLSEHAVFMHSLWSLNSRKIQNVKKKAIEIIGNE